MAKNTVEAVRTGNGDHYYLNKAAKKCGQIAEEAYKQRYAVRAAREIMRQTGLTDIKNERASELSDSGLPSPYRLRILEIYAPFELEAPVKDSDGDVLLPSGEVHLEEEKWFGAPVPDSVRRLPDAKENFDQGVIWVRHPVWGENDARQPRVSTVNMIPSSFAVDSFCAILFTIADEKNFQLPHVPLVLG